MSLLQKALDQIQENGEEGQEIDISTKLKYIKYAMITPYGYCKLHDLLVNDSAEDFMMEFMSAYNNEVGFYY